MTNPLRVFIETVSDGCAVSNNDSIILSRYYEKKFGYQIAKDPQQADLIVINTCGVIQSEEDKSIRKIDQYSKDFGSDKIHVTGCLPRINPPRLRSEFKGSVVGLDEARKYFFENPTIEEQEEFFFKKEDLNRLHRRHQFVFFIRRILQPLLSLKTDSTWLTNLVDTAAVNLNYRLITVAQGCLSQCTFCTIRKAKGRLKSISLEYLTAQATAISENSAQKIWLLGDDVGCWGMDQGKTSKDLLNMYLQTPGIDSIAIGYFDPTYLVSFGKQLLPILGNRKITHMNVSMQSGSDRILALMGRIHPAQQVRDLLSGIKKSNPNICLKANFIIGFPTETWRDFFKSMRQAAAFDVVFAMKFDGRPGTPAAKMTEQVPEVTKSLRLFLMNTFLLFHHSRILMSAVRKFIFSV